MGLFKKPMLFLIGGTGYVGLELLWRGRSHGSMFLAGGISFLLLGRLRHDKFWQRGVRGAMAITQVELATGLLFNRNYQVWDYRKLPLNFRGQICLPYSLLWIPVSWGAEALYGLLDRGAACK